MRNILLKNKKNSLLYKETDTHWNNNGAYYGYKAIREKMEELFPDVYFGKEIKYDISKTKKNGGDLLPILGVKEYGALSVFDYTPENGYPYIIRKNKERNVVVTDARDIDVSPLPRAVIFRDSFFVSLQPFVSSLFSEAIYHWKAFDSKDKKMVLDEKPDIVIFEIVERYMGDLTALK